jgi:hypothetical protein
MKPRQKKTLKGCKKSNKIQIDNFFERVQNKQQEVIFKWNLIYDEL